jgi:hypothetical protein
MSEAFRVFLFGKVLRGSSGEGHSSNSLGNRVIGKEKRKEGFLASVIGLISAALVFTAFLFLFVPVSQGASEGDIEMNSLRSKPRGIASAKFCFADREECY